MKDFEKTSRNRTRSNFVVDTQQGDWPPITGVKTIALLKMTNWIYYDKLDILVLTETWLCDNARDSAILDYYLPNYQFLHKPRAQRGGGVGVILRKGYDTHELVSNQYSSFEHLDLAISSGSTHLHLLSVYRPPPSKKNKLTVAKFMNDFSALLETIIISSGKLIITGDLNFHMDDVPLNQDASLFMDLLDYYGLVQYVSSSTHARGHLLDLIITKPNTFVGSQIDTSVSFTLPSDHALVTYSIAMPRPKPVRIQVNHRKLRRIDVELLRDDIRASFSNKQMLTFPTKLIIITARYGLSLINMHLNAYDL